MKNLSLFLIATSNCLIISIFLENKLLESQREKLNQNLVEKMFVCLREILKKQKKTLNEVNKIYCGNGPGSYTSNRAIAVFLSLLKVMRKTIQIHILSNLLLLAGMKNKTISLIEANKREYFLSGFDQGKIKIPFQKIAKNNLLNIQKKHSDFCFVNEKTIFDIEKRFHDLKSFFYVVENYHKIFSSIENF